MSFTTTQDDPIFFQIVRDSTGNVAGEGGLVTFMDSAWVMSIVLPHQPHFIGQPDDVKVFWGYGLSVDKPGDFVRKPMSACTGREVMMELLGHLRIDALADRILDDSICIPCMMPFITSQFLRRQPGDRPHVVPEGWTNLAFVGQFCEIPDDVVFTVEYSVRSAQAAVCSLLAAESRAAGRLQGAIRPSRALSGLHDLARHRLVNGVPAVHTLPLDGTLFRVHQTKNLLQRKGESCLTYSSRLSSPVLAWRA